MKLEIITGHAEYLLPRRLPYDHLLAALRSIEPRARIPLVRWAADTPSHYHDFLDDKDFHLFCDYLEDTTGAEEVAFVILPPPAFVSLARHRYAAGCRRLYLSEPSRAVLRTLRPEDDATGIAIDSLLPVEGMRANYTRAILRLFERSLAMDPPSRRGHAERVADFLEENCLAIRSDLPSAHLLAAFQDGGELHTLLARPLDTRLAAAAPESVALERLAPT